ncbi:MAG: phage holin family protein [Anaerolineales bacterium]|nr:phage holin family protein [Anaerolineales bacterium]MCB9126983.1 phage holin family protein [Ardenticatenales bacterium]
MNEERIPTPLPVRPTPRDSVTTIVSDLVSSTQMLARQEVERVKAEAMERVDAVKGEAQEKGKGIGMLVGAGIFLIIALALLGITLFFALYELAGLVGWLSALIVTLLYILIALILALIGRHMLQSTEVTEGDESP